MTAATFEVIDPATETVIGVVADSTVDEAIVGVEVAASAFPAWRAISARDRAEILRRCFDLMVGRTEDLATLIAAENGKSMADARAEVAYAAEFFRWYSEEAVRSGGSYGDAPAGGAKSLVTHVPVGVAALITPWNFPAAMATRKIAPALAAGCTVVLKPAEETPLTAMALAKIMREAGVPHGVVNIVPTTDAPSVVTAWLNDDRVRKISFTGSTSVGRALLRQAADRIVNASMELGGNAPFIVTADADIDDAINGAMTAKFRGGGQACTAANRFYVHVDVAHEFVAKLSIKVATLRVGPSSDEENQIGPVISARALARIAALVDEAVADGARIALQGTVPDVGWFYPPTIVVDVPAGARLMTEEIFGPVAPIVTWTDEAEMLKQVNGNEFGLAAYVYAGRLQDALRIGEEIDAGMVGINRGVVSDPSAPFGGTKQSGIGREGAHEGMRAYQEARYFSIGWD